jgi:hypothetical protein
LSSGNVTVHRGFGKRPSKAEVEVITNKVEDLMLNGGLCAKDICRELNMPASTVDRYIKRVRERIAMKVSDSDRQKFIADTVADYSVLIQETWDLLREARKIIEVDKRVAGTAKVLDTIGKSMKHHEQFMERFMKYAGEEGAGLTGDDVVNRFLASPQWTEMQNLMTDFLDSKGLDPAEYVDYIEKRMMGIDNTRRDPPLTETERNNKEFEEGFVEEIGEFIDIDAEDPKEVVKDETRDSPTITQ